MLTKASPNSVSTRPRLGLFCETDSDPYNEIGHMNGASYIDISSN